MSNPVDEFLNQHEGEQREWLTTFVDFMRANYPHIPEIISYGIPTYKSNRMYVAFSVAKEHFTFHTLDFDLIEAFKSRLPGAKFGKGSAKVPYAHRDKIPTLFDAIRQVAERHWK